MSIADPSTLTILEQDMLPVLHKMLNDTNDDDNQEIAETMYQIGFQYARRGLHQKAQFYIERCMLIYQRLWPICNASLKQCQAYVMKQDILPDSSIFMKQCDNINDLFFNAWYEYQNTTDSEKQQIWGM